MLKVKKIFFPKIYFLKLFSFYLFIYSLGADKSRAKGTIIKEYIKNKRLTK